MKDVLIVNRDTFEASTKHQYKENLSDNYESRDVPFKCGCGEEHHIGEDGVKLVKRVGMLEFVASCQNDFHTLLLSEVESFGPKMNLIEYTSLMSIEASKLS